MHDLKDTQRISKKKFKTSVGLFEVDYTCHGTHMGDQMTTYKRQFPP